MLSLVLLISLAGYGNIITMTDNADDENDGSEPDADEDYDDNFTDDPSVESFHDMYKNLIEEKHWIKISFKKFGGNYDFFFFFFWSGGMVGCI